MFQWLWTAGFISNPRRLLLFVVVPNSGAQTLVVVLPEVDADIGSKLRWADAVLLPGGGDLDPSFYGEEPATDTIYDVDRLQDAFDLAVARWAVDEGVALLAICRGTQVVNVACGGTLHQDIGSSHRARTQVAIEPGSRLGGLLGEEPFVVSCLHDQTLA